MDNAGIKKAIEKIRLDLLSLASSVLSDDNVGINIKTGKNTLRDSALRGDLEARIDSLDNPVITALFNNYVTYLEWDRPPKYKGKPPINTLKEWASKNSIPTDANTLWAISYAIWRDGHAGRPIFATMDNEVDGLFMNTWADELFDSITENLDNFFKD